MRLIPVIDLMQGHVVHGKGGRREQYQPIESNLVPGSSSPVAIGRALRESYSPQEMYLADLDAIMGASPDWYTIAELQQWGCDLWVDAGVRNHEAIRQLAKVGVAGIVCGLETIAGPEVLEAAITEFGSSRIFFSLDLREGRLLGQFDTWEIYNPSDVLTVARRAIDIGVRKIIVLDLARVGSGKGTGTQELCRTLNGLAPDVELFAGGGIRDTEDVQRLAEVGVAGVLVASALHNGSIRPEEWRSIPIHPSPNVFREY